MMMMMMTTVTMTMVIMIVMMMMMMVMMIVMMMMIMIMIMMTMMMTMMMMMLNVYSPALHYTLKFLIFIPPTYLYVTPVFHGLSFPMVPCSSQDARELFLQRGSRQRPRAARMFRVNLLLEG